VEKVAAEQRFSLMTLTALVVGSMVGAGIFALPTTFGNATGPCEAVH
jgi:arginine:ornithine antiporter / lysine permease